MITKFHKGKQKIKVIKNSKMDFYLVAGSRPFTHVQISWLVDSFYVIPFLNKTKYMLDNLAYELFNTPVPQNLSFLEHWGLFSLQNSGLKLF